MTTKTCSTCKEPQPLTAFTRSKRTSDGLVSQCSSCRKEYVSKRRMNPEVRAKESAYSAQWYQNNKDTKTKQAKRWRERNLEKSRAYVNTYAAKNRAAKQNADRERYHQNLDSSRSRARANYASNPESKRTAVKRWRKGNLETVRAWGRAWAQLNKEKYTARASYRRQLKQHMSDFDRFVMQEAAKLCSLRRLATSVSWQIDHIVPLSKGGTHEASNLQVVPAAWNAAKRNRHCEKYFG